VTARFHSARGITLIEATIVLTAVAVLSAVAAPTLSRGIDSARLSRAVSDMEAIKAAIANFAIDIETGQGGTQAGFTINGQGNGTPVDILVSDGDIPTLGPNGGTAWDDPVDNTTGLVDFLERHLVTNNPRGSALNAYPIPAGAGEGWRGAYINGPVDPDPWGNRYAVNTQRLITTPRDVDVIVLTAGPDEEIDTAYNVTNPVPGDDDILVIIRRDPGRTVP